MRMLKKTALMFQALTRSQTRLCDVWRGSSRVRQFLTSGYHSNSDRNRTELTGVRDLLCFSENAEADSWSMTVIPDFISTEEEDHLMADVSRSLRGKKYQFDHWDGVSILRIADPCIHIIH